MSYNQNSHNRDFVYCDGKNCVLRWRCRRFIEWQKIIANRNGDTNQWYWMPNCDEETREAFLST